MEQKIDARIHHSDEIGIQSVYDNSGDVTHNEYALEMYIFAPKTLKINKYTYEKNDFFSDLTEYMRFKTPEIEIKKIADLKKHNSPINKLILLQKRENKNFQDIKNELKFISCIYIKAVQKLVKTNNKTKVLSELDGAKNFRKIFWELMEENKVSPEIYTTYRMVDEYIAVSMDYALNALVIAKKDNNIKKMANRLLDEEIKNIKSKKYEILKNKCERLSYRRNLLKKMIFNVLFLDVREKPGINYLDIGYSISAAIAMFLFLVLTFIYSDLITSSTLLFVMLSVLAYAFKDRVKEWLRIYFKDLIAKKFPDRKREIYDSSTNQIVGECNESVYFMNKDEVDDKILLARNRNLSESEEKLNLEEIIKYEKRFKLNNKVLSNHKKGKKVADIIYLNIKRFLARMSDPYCKIPNYNPKTKSSEYLFGSRVYHINFIFKLSTKKYGLIDEKIERIRAVVDKNGIKRLEKVDVLTV